VKTASDTVTIVAVWTGTTPAPAERLRLVLPLAETRQTIVNGGVVSAQNAMVLGVMRKFIDIEM
jgi:alpha-glucosidase